MSTIELSCPSPATSDCVQLAHGGGGRRMRQLIDEIFLQAFEAGGGRGSTAAERHDSAVMDVEGGRIALTTDSYVVSPRFFPGGDIGSLAVYGTVNDLAMAGAEARWLTAGFILEEGLPIAELKRVVASMQAAAEVAGVQIVTGDTKVVDKGKGDGIFINTAGVGLVADGLVIAPSQVRPGDGIVISGDLGRHGIAVMSVREGLSFEGAVDSDCGWLGPPVSAMLQAGLPVRCMRDLTRGGLASTLNEIALDAALDIEIEEQAMPVHETVAGACEMLGLDPLYVACEGRMVAFVAEEAVDEAVRLMAQHAIGAGACRIGRVQGRAPAGRSGRVTLRGSFGGERALDLLSGEQLPRIC